MQKSNLPICVDLDGTILKTDTLWESLTNLIKTRPWKLVTLLVSLCRGKAAFKHQLAQIQPLAISLLPYNEKLLEWLQSQYQQGTVLVLVTASNQAIAQEIAQHLGIFSKVLASDQSTNLIGEAKCAKLLALYGNQGFDYIGNSWQDMPVWLHARKAFLVDPPAGLEQRVRAEVEVGAIFQEAIPPLYAVLKALRPHQWSKNILLLIPLLAAHQFSSTLHLWSVLLAFGAFSLAASATYVLNDGIDLEADRSHPNKRKRPFASGELPLWMLPVLVLLLLASSLALSWPLPYNFKRILTAYWIANLAYSLWLKKLPILDVIVLAGFYILRLFAGGIATGVSISFWLTTFSMFFFISLAFAKRINEVYLIREDMQAMQRGYRNTDTESLSILGTCSGYISVVVLALYINNPDVTRLYAHPELLWLWCPAILYWISRLWLFIRRKELICSDPLLFSITDKASYMVALTCAGIASWAAQ